MNKNAFFALLSVGSAALLLSSCSNAKEKLGLVRSAPDEFAVIKRAPLEMPPEEYRELPVPSPGAGRPQERTPVVEARRTVFGKAFRDEKAASEAEAILLQQTGAEATDPEIRNVVDREVVELVDENRPVADRLLEWTGALSGDAPTRVVDPEDEAERIKRNLEQDMPVNEGDTPSIRQ